MSKQQLPTGKITATLKGPVWMIFSELVPEFRGLDGERFYDLVMGDSEMLYGCFGLFRRFRSKFSAILSDERGRVINDDFVRFPCGRTMHEIIAMIVRTHAKTHFRRVLAGNPADPATPAGGLYRAIRDYLLHDWQSRLVPAYAGLSVSTVNRLGPAILDARDLGDLNALVEHGAIPERSHGRGAAATAAEPKVAANVTAAPTPGPQPATTPASQLEDLFWQAANDPSVIAVIGARPGDQLREMVAVIGNVGSAVQRDLGGVLQFDPPRLFVCLAKALDILGRSTFTRVFGEPGDPFVIDALASRMAAGGIGRASPLAEVQAGLAAILRTDPRTGLVILPG